MKHFFIQRNKFIAVVLAKKKTFFTENFYILQTRLEQGRCSDSSFDKQISSQILLTSTLKYLLTFLVKKHV